MRTDKLIAIVYHSGYGHTQRQAEAVRAGVEQVKGVEALLLTVQEAQTRWEDLAHAEAIIFGAPTYVAGASAAFKAFQEASSHAVMATGYAWQDKIAAGFTNSGSRSGDKLATLIQIALFAAQHGMHWVNLGLRPANHSTAGSEEDLNRLGFWLGAGAQSNVDQGPDAAPPQADLRTAEHLGRRVAETTLDILRGRLIAVDTPDGSMMHNPGFDAAPFPPEMSAPTCVTASCSCDGSGDAVSSAADAGRVDVAGGTEWR